MVAAISKTPCLDEIREAGSIIFLAVGNLLIAVRLQNAQLLGLLGLLLSMRDREQKLFEFDYTCRLPSA